jgi:hypothetical protein
MQRVKSAKDLPPSTKGIIPGIEIDTVQFTVALPANKLAHTTSALAYHLSALLVTLLNLQSIAGLLQFATKILPRWTYFYSTYS